MSTLTRANLLAFIREQKWAVEASVSPERTPQAAVIGVALTEAFELVFDTMGDTRKAQNLRANPSIALVIGWDAGQTVQLEGTADEPQGAELVALKQVYFARFPDGLEREAWPGIAYFRVRPRWLRYSDFRGDAPIILECDAKALQREDLGRSLSSQS